MPEVQPRELEEAMSVLMTGADSSSAALLGYVPPKASPCANTTAAEGGPKANCGNEANLSCGKCQLVRVSHWISAMCSSHTSSTDLVPSCCLTKIGSAKVLHNKLKVTDPPPVLQQRVSSLPLADPQVRLQV